MGNFLVQTKASWQKEPGVLSLTDLKSIMPSYPLVERKFFDDLVDRCHRYPQQYYVQTALMKVTTQDQKPLDPDIWIVVWAEDFKGRIFQMLFERNPEYGGKGAIAALGPTDLVEFFSSMKYNAVLPTLTLLNTPEKMKQVAVLVSRPKSYREQLQERQTNEHVSRFKNWIEQLKVTPNPQGQWFPQHQVINQCPKCGASMAGVAGMNTMYGILICPTCGHTIAKPLNEIGQPPPTPKK